MLGSQTACNSESNFVRTEMKLSGIISLTALLATCLVISAQVWCFLSLHGLQRTPILSILKGKRGRQEKVVDGIMMMMMMMTISGKIFGSIELCVCKCVCVCLIVCFPFWFLVVCLWEFCFCEAHGCRVMFVKSLRQYDFVVCVVKVE